MLSPAGTKNLPTLARLTGLQAAAKQLPSPALLEGSVYKSNTERLSPRVFEVLRTLNQRVQDIQLWLAQARDMLSPWAHPSARRPWTSMCGGRGTCRSP